jgi:hypothetical protein
MSETIFCSKCGDEMNIWTGEIPAICDECEETKEEKPETICKNTDCNIEAVEGIDLCSVCASMHCSKCDRHQQFRIALEIVLCDFVNDVPTFIALVNDVAKKLEEGGL